MAPPLLTKAQWRKTDVAKKPGASYQGYVNWVTKTRAKRAAAQAAQMNDPNYAMNMFNQAMAQAGAQATSDVKSQVDAAIAGVQASTKAAQEQSNRQAARAEDFATALAQL